MGVRSDDLASLLTARPSGPGQPLSYRQGTVVTFDKITLENTIDIGRPGVPVIMQNLPVLGVAEATTLEPGDTVGLLATGSMLAILGQLVIPSTPAAATAISVASSNVYTAQIDTTDATTSTSFVDLPNFPGPVLSGVRIGPSGRCLVILSAIMTAFIAPGAEMGYEITGATSVAPSIFGKTLAFYSAAGNSLSGSRVILQAGLNPGLHTFTGKYLAGGGGASAQFSFRNITVIAL